MMLPASSFFFRHLPSSGNEAEAHLLNARPPSHSRLYQALRCESSLSACPSLTFILSNRRTSTRLSFLFLVMTVVLVPASEVPAWVQSNEIGIYGGVACATLVTYDASESRAAPFFYAS